MDWAKGWKCVRMLWFIYKNRNSLEERYLRVLVEVESLYDIVREEWERDSE